MADDYIRRNPAGTRSSGAPRSASSRPAARPSGYSSSSEGIRRTSSGARPSGSRPAGSRPAGARPSSTRPSGSRPAGSRPSSASRYDGRAPQRRPARRRRRRSMQPRFFLIIAILVVIVVALVVLLTGGRKDPTVTPMATPTPAPQNGAPNVEVFSEGSDTSTDPIPQQQAPASDAASLSAQLDDSDSEVAALDAADRIQVSAAELSVNPNLPDEWMNIALLGTDERTLNESARTDAILICSINKNTGRVKLTSIARDTAIKITGTNKYDGTYRINSLNFFGGPNYVMKFLNENLNMNIQYYATVNFFGFQKIATALGGIDVNITEAEMKEINKKQIEQAKIGYNAGLDESHLENVLLETYGENTHLNGRQALAYARVRYTDSDMSRMERQRTVLVKMMEKLRGKSTTELMLLATQLLDCVTTNMDLNFILDVAMTVLGNGMDKVDSLRLPINGSFVEERRNDKAMLYDTDWPANSNELYNFIYVS